MAGRIVAGGRVISITPDLRRRSVPLRLGVPRDADGRTIDSAFSLARPGEPKLQSGVVVYDRLEKTSYRCVARLDPLEGWAPTEFWQKRWKVPHGAIIAYVDAGFLDAAVEEGSQVRRYRCRDEWRLLHSELHAKHIAPPTKKRTPRAGWKRL